MDRAGLSVGARKRLILLRAKGIEPSPACGELRLSAATVAAGAPIVLALVNGPRRV